MKLLYNDSDNTSSLLYVCKWSMLKDIIKVIKVNKVKRKLYKTDKI